jgi:replication-associated recombination protein RarA
MNSMFNNYVFPDRLEKTLTGLVERTEVFGGFVSFYGEPGIGKTSFAKKFGENYFNDVMYVPCNEEGLPKKDWENLLSRLRSVNIFGEEANKMNRLFIIDEFHNLPRNKQDKFKTLFDQLNKDNLFIFIFNTDGNKRKGVDHYLSPAMKSRCKNISFDVRSCENEEVLEKAISLYQHLDKDLVNDLLPDHRQLQRENQLAELIG